MDTMLIDLIIPLTLLGLVAYLIGSIPFGLVLCKMAGYGDIRQMGSGGIGATNVLRNSNKVLALLTLILDAGKGAFVVYLISEFLIIEESIPQFSFDPHTVLMCWVGIMAIIGHNFPVWLHFKGGKGVATTFGTIMVLSPVVAGACFATWLGVAFITRYSSLSALVAFTLSPVWAYLLLGNMILVVTLVLLAILGFWQHRENIQRLRDGTESKIGEK